MIPEEYIKDAPYNMSLFFYMELSELRKLKSKAMISGDIFAYRDILEEIFTNISFKLKPEEKQIIKDYFVDANNLMEGLDLLDDEEQVKAFGVIKKTLREADLKIIRFMDKYKMIFPRAKIQGGIDSIKKQYGLD